MAFTKLFSEIVTSSIWAEDDKTRIVWVTMLATCDAQGVVRASVSGLAHVARVDRAGCEQAIEVLISPDPDSRSEEFEGRRIRKCDGGWEILNYSKYRAARTKDERKAYMTNYMREYRKSQAVNKSVNVVNDNKQSLAMLAQAEGEAEADNVLCGGTKPPPTGHTTINHLIEKNTQGVDDAKDFELSCMEPIEAMALLQREHPDIDVWGEFGKLKERCKTTGTKPTWRSFLGWLRKASPVARIPKKPRNADVLEAPDPKEEQEARRNAIRTLKEWRESGASYQGIKNQLNGQGGPFPAK